MTYFINTKAISTSHYKYHQRVKTWYEQNTTMATAESIQLKLRMQQLPIAVEQRQKHLT
jgi:hypothetical protein